jgi:hypothetical protein
VKDAGSHEVVERVVYFCRGVLVLAFPYFSCTFQEIEPLFGSPDPTNQRFLSVCMRERADTNSLALPPALNYKVSERKRCAYYTKKV